MTNRSEQSLNTEIVEVFVESEPNLPQTTIETAILEANAKIPQQIWSLSFFILDAIISNPELSLEDLSSMKCLSERALQAERNSMKALHEKYQIPVFHVNDIFVDGAVNPKITKMLPQLSASLENKADLLNNNSLEGLFIVLRKEFLPSRGYMVEPIGNPVAQVSVSLNQTKVKILCDERSQIIFRQARDLALDIVSSKYYSDDLVPCLVSSIKDDPTPWQEYRDSFREGRDLGAPKHNEILAGILKNILATELNKSDMLGDRLSLFLKDILRRSPINLK